jgi:hypothetical protein
MHLYILMSCYSDLLITKLLNRPVKIWTGNNFVKNT